jgi:hypothetical protein
MEAIQIGRLGLHVSGIGSPYYDQLPKHSGYVI